MEPLANVNTIPSENEECDDAANTVIPAERVSILDEVYWNVDSENDEEHSKTGLHTWA